MVSSIRDNPHPELPGELTQFSRPFTRGCELVSGGRDNSGGGGGASCLTSAGRITLAGGTTFLYENTFSRLLETRQLKQKMRANAVTRARAYYNYPFPVVHHFVEYINWPGRTRVSRCQISYKRSVDLSRVPETM